MPKFFLLPISDSDGIPAAAIEARRAALDKLEWLCGEFHCHYHAADQYYELDAMNAVNEMPGVLAEIQKPLIPKPASKRKPRKAAKPKLRIRRAAAS